jgi:hypothetical protein
LRHIVNLNNQDFNGVIIAILSRGENLVVKIESSLDYYNENTSEFREVFSIVDTENSYFDTTFSVDLSDLSIMNKHNLKTVDKLNKSSFDKILRKFLHFMLSGFLDENKKLDYINPSGKILGKEELFNMIDASLDIWLTAGRFDNKFCQYFGKYLKKLCFNC